MKHNPGRCLLPERMADKQLSVRQLAAKLQTKPALLDDYIACRRIMPLRNAAAIAHALECSIEDLYEWPEEEP